MANGESTDIASGSAPGATRPLSEIPKVILKPRRARPFFGRHPWVFHGAIQSVQGKPQPGDLVQLVSHEKEFIAFGLYNENSNIRVRLYSWDKDRPVDGDLIVERIERAWQLRQQLGLDDPAGGCRVIYSESDGLSGLIVDRYADVLVVQFTSLAMARHQDVILQTLERLLHPRGVYRRTERGIGEMEGLDVDDSLLAGEVPSESFPIVENGLKLLVDPRTGQKTGGFLDQRDNRLALCRYTKGRSVLDMFCHGGGFSLMAMKFGQASSAMGIDVSGTAVALAQQNAELNTIAAEYVQEDAVGAMIRLKGEGKRFGVVVCDPPKFARTSGAVEKAVKGYEQVNRLALDLLEPGGILLTCSCSGHVSATDFHQLLASAAQKADRSFAILEQRGQAPDHPVSVYCLETGYLKCVIGRVD